MRLVCADALLEAERGFKSDLIPDSSTEIMVELNGAELKHARYAILSHCWGVPDEGQKEVQFREMSELLSMNGTIRNEVRRRTGYMKILETCRRAREDGLELVWIDTCCINKESSSELSEAINSMYKWYAGSDRCYTYLHDVETSEISADPDRKAFPKSNGLPKWFSRGWTLQELVAPQDIRFFNSRWEFIGRKKNLVDVLNWITQIPHRVLEEGLDSKRPSVAQIMSWASHRSTTREEDQAYSLLGLLGVYMPMLYGEGKHAFRRLQLEIMRTSNDQSIFAWGWQSRWTGWSNSFLADDPSYFRDCSDVVTMHHDEFVEALGCDVPEADWLNIPVKRLRTFTVTNDGIQIWLPLTPCEGSSSFFEATLACHCDGEYPVTIVLGRSKSNYFRYFGCSPNSGTVRIQFEEVILPYKDDYHENDFGFELHCSGFSRQSVIPAGTKLAGNTLTLSNVNDFAVVTYKHSEDDVYFAVTFCYCRRKHSTRIICANEHISESVFQRLHLNALEDILSTERSVAGSQDAQCNSLPVLQHFHFPRSVQGVRMVSTNRASLQNRCAVTLSTDLCPGCCGPDSNAVYKTRVFGFVKDAMWNSPSAMLAPNDGSPPPLSVRANVPEIRLGDYGRLYSADGGVFEQQGNISDLDVGSSIQVFDPVEQKIDQKYCEMLGNAIVKVIRSVPFPGRLLHRNAIAWSLPNNPLKDLSAYLTGSCLVTTLVILSEFYFTEDPGNWIKESKIAIPLYTPFHPLLWQEEKCDWTLKERLGDLRFHFFLLLGWDASVVITTEDVIRLLKDVFGGNRFKEYVGELTFFHRLPLMVANKRNDRACAELGKSGSPCKITAPSGSASRVSPDPYDWEETEAAKDLRVEALVKQLMLTANSDVDPGHYTRQPTTWDQAWHLKSASFGVELLREIGSVYTNLMRAVLWCDRRAVDTCNVDVRMYLCHF